MHEPRTLLKNQAEHDMFGRGFSGMVVDFANRSKRAPVRWSGEPVLFCGVGGADGERRVWSVVMPDSSKAAHVGVGRSRNSNAYYCWYVLRRVGIHVPICQSLLSLAAIAPVTCRICAGKRDTLNLFVPFTLLLCRVVVPPWKGMAGESLVHVLLVERRVQECCFLRRRR